MVMSLSGTLKKSGSGGVRARITVINARPGHDGVASQGHNSKHGIVGSLPTYSFGFIVRETVQYFLPGLWAYLQGECIQVAFSSDLRIVAGFRSSAWPSQIYANLHSRVLPKLHRPGWFMFC